MSNFKNFFIRLFPFKKNEISEKVIFEIVKNVKEICFDNSSFYYSPKHNQYLDINFHFRNWLPEFFITSLIVDNFHVWVRKGDEGGWFDYIGFYSNKYTVENKYIDQLSKSYSSISSVMPQYLNSCLYKADKLTIKGFNENIKTDIKNIFKQRFSHAKPEIILTENFKWSLDLPIRYLSAGYSEFNCLGKLEKMQNLDIHKHFVLRGNLWNIISEDLTNGLEEFLKKLRDDKNINSFSYLELEHNGKTVFKMINEKGKKYLSQNSFSSWENCIDIEYIRFLTWYNFAA